MTVIGTVKEIWRYPVKSMRGERLDQCMISGKGLTGDRGWTVRDDTVKEIRSGRTMPGLLDCTAEYLTEPRGEPYPINHRGQTTIFGEKGRIKRGRNYFLGCSS
jgi:hypothetical protein